MTDHIQTDHIQRFTFANLPIRGEILTLTDSFQTMCHQHQYQSELRHLLGEALAASALLAEIIKIDGKIAVQLQSPSAVKVLLAECNHQGGLRGLIQKQSEIATGSTFRDWTRDGQMAITIEPKQGQRYQGVVSLEKDTLSECIENYFELSEQLPTQIRLFVESSEGKERVTALLLQALPESDETVREEAFDHVSALANTIKPEEALELGHEQLLYRLFHQDEVTLYPSKTLQFECVCTPERLEQTLLTLEPSDLVQLLKEQDGEIEMTCDFCSNQQIFHEEQVMRLLAESSTSDSIN